MSNILIPNFPFCPDHFAYDGIKTHNSELIQTLIRSPLKVSMLLSLEQVPQKANKMSVEDLINKKSFTDKLMLKSKSFLFKMPSMRNKYKCNAGSFSGIELNQTQYQDLHLLTKIYMEEFLKKRALIHFKNTNTLYELKNFENYAMFLQSYPFPLIAKGSRNIVIILDIKPLTHPNFCPNPEKFRNLLTAIFRKYDKILTISNYTKEALIKYFKIDERKIDVVYLTIKKTVSFSPQNADAYLRSLKITHKKYLLYVARISPRKNHERLLEAYQMAKIDMPLVLVGSANLYNKIAVKLIKSIKMKYSGSKQNNEIPLRGKKKIIWLDQVSDAQLNILYGSAKGLIFPSLIEGFGLPIVEAFAHSCPVAAANVTAIPEIAGDAAILFNPYSVEEIALSLEKLVHDKDLCSHLAKMGKLRAEFFSLEKYKERLIQAVGT